MGGLSFLFNSSYDPTTGEALEPSSTYIMSWLVMYGITVSIIPLIRWRFNIGDGIVIAIGLYYLLTTLWSHIPSNTSKYSFSLMMNIVAAIVISKIIPKSKFPAVLAKVITLVAVVSIILWLMGDPRAIWHDPHQRLTILGTESVKGLFFHKIPAGIYAAVGASLSMILFRGWFRLVAVAICVLFDCLTGSSIGLALLPILAAMVGLLNASRSGRLSAGMFFSLIIGMIIFGIASFYFIGSEILVLLDRDPTLTGRTLLWGWGLEVAMQRPLLGWGFFGYFGSDEAAAVARSIRVFRNYDVPHFHNSYIQTIAEIGIPAAALLFITLFCTLNGWYRMYLRTSEPAYKAYALLGMMILVVGGFSLLFMRYNDISTFLVLISICYLHQPLKRVAPKSSNEALADTIEG